MRHRITLSQTNYFENLIYSISTIYVNTTGTAIGPARTQCNLDWIAPTSENPVPGFPHEFIYNYTEVVLPFNNTVNITAIESIGFSELASSIATELGYANCSGAGHGAGTLKVGVTQLTSTSYHYTAQADLGPTTSSLTSATQAAPSLPPPSPTPAVTTMPSLPTSPSSKIESSTVQEPQASSSDTPPTTLEVPVPSTPGAIAPPSVSITTYGTNTVTISPLTPNSGYVVNSATLTAGGSAATIGSQVFSAGTSGLEVTTPETAAGPFTPTTISLSAVSVTTYGTNAVTISPASTGYVVNSATLTAGGSATTIGSQVFSAGSPGLEVVTGTSPATGISATSITTYGTNTVTISPLSPESGYVVNSATFTAGGSATTIGSEIFSAGSSGLVIVSGTSTVSLGSIILNVGGVGGSTATTATSTTLTAPAQFTGAARRNIGRSELMVGVIAGVGAVFSLL